jgi:hypothetical protein
MVLGQPDRVVAGSVHDREPFERAIVDGRKRDVSIRPPEELQNPDLHRLCTP